MNTDPHGAIKFGEFRKYMQNKQAKLSAQEKEIKNQSSQELPQIFTGLSIHINGYTKPPSSDLRKTIIQHGGSYQHYLKKRSVTHILATNLTNSKMQEFRAYKIVLPDWIVDSVKARQLLPWQNYRLVYSGSRQKELAFEKRNASQEHQPVTANPGFIQRYYETSRLHYLSTWKAELKEIVKKLKPGSSELSVEKKRKRGHRVIMHIDFDCFFASASLLSRPHLHDKPVAVAHNSGTSEVSSSDIASCNYIARSFGVCNGMVIQTAKALCPDLQIVPYEFNIYRSISEKFYQILFQYTDEIEAVSVDEALIEVGSHINIPYHGEEEALALNIRNKIRSVTGCETSIGIGSNILLARMSTKKAKPANHFYCKSSEDIEELLASQSVTDLPGVGHATEEKLVKLGVKKIVDIRDIALHTLKSTLGQKLGQTIYHFSRGIDHRPLAVYQERQSVSAEVNWGVRFEKEEVEKTFVYDLCKEVSERLKNCGKRGKTITVKVLKRQEGAEEPKKYLGHGKVDSFSKSYTMKDPTDNLEVVYGHVYSLLKSFRFDCKDIRGIGIQITKLDIQDNTECNVLNKRSGIPIMPTVSRIKQNRMLSVTEEDLIPHKKSKNAVGLDDKKKEPINVDPEVYAELPKNLQQELASNYQLEFHEPNANTAISQDSQLPELPPWSQLDPMSLLALPETMRERILKAYSEKNRMALQNWPQAESVGFEKENKTTLTQMPSKTATHAPTKKMTDTPRVFNETPKKEKKNQPSILDLDTIGEPPFQGLKDIEDIRNLLSEWVMTFEDEPESEDVEKIEQYIVDLVKQAYIEKAYLVMKYLEYKTKDSNVKWKFQVEHMKQCLNNQIMQTYHVPLKW
ncbi:hypothetical protein BY458DRAFT_589924 [Sporodiniella umbellata]|nr:hypothetical protein BY458DRAFT_589924 [Sporodiniella umbellata]